MTNGPQKIQQFYEFKPAVEFPYLRRLEWTTIPLVSGCTRRLLLHLTKSVDARSETELVLEFQDVQNIKLAPGSMGVVLQIRDVSGQQWEGVNYDVSDVEQGTVSFLCRDFSLSLKETAQ